MNAAVVIPAYNEAGAIGPLVEQARHLGIVVVVDDGSTDATAAVARGAGATVVIHDHNRGYDSALASGFDAAVAAGADVILTMDGDGQHVPEVGKRLLHCIDDGSADIVVGRRPAKARWSEHVFAFYTRVRFHVPDPLCGMKAYRADLVTRHRDALDHTTIGTGLMVAALASGARLAVVDVLVRPRAGRSRFGGRLEANLRITKGLAAAIAIDARTKSGGVVTLRREESQRRNTEPSEAVAVQRAVVGARDTKLEKPSLFHARFDTSRVHSHASGGGVGEFAESHELASSCEAAPRLRADVQVVAFYLPQFHPIPENDEWWGPGFSEWTNVARARRLYPGHYQPRIPGELGFYDLRLPETRAAQAALAAQHSVTAFCYWHYWFGAGRRLLTRPFEEVLKSGEPRFPFCLAWANESWSGVWHGSPSKMLIEQTYPGEADYRAHFETVLPALVDARYFHIGGRPMFYVYNPSAIPDAQRFMDLWRRWAEEAGLPGLYFVGELSSRYQQLPSADYDAFVLVRGPLRRVRAVDLPRRFARAIGVPPIRSYQKFSETMPLGVVGKTSFPSVIPGYDNTPRSGAAGVVLHGATPEAFKSQVMRAVAHVACQSPQERRVIFVKSWNEWAEGQYLEPDRRFGRAFLKALQAGIGESVANPRQRDCDRA